MTKERMTKLYGMMSAFNEAFTTVEVDHEIHHNVSEEGDSVPMDFYHITFNSNEFLTLTELEEIKGVLGEILQKNGVDTSKIKMGRSEKADFSSMVVTHNPLVDCK